MKLDFLKKLYEEDLLSVEESFDTWQDAVKASILPMVNKKMVTPAYGDEILKSVDEYGLYIFLCPHICMPHCKAFSEVMQSGACLMKVNQPVYPIPDDPSTFAELFFAIAGTDADHHLDCVQDFMEILDDEETVEALLQVQSMEDLKQLIYGGK
ncbi:PTS sugar transporter subunit IIA [Colidextribacter sp. OB.20]|uniref:PTS sugar transporter subunit IIA n=1 Tax=Colidextribacter sp. OB.20 TaxID=2304568 RepID=UPI001368378B|nr:PTS sugar transporter subunit IIA [Colidextribacter sp. OB.20]NBI11615.1 PTS sugar transporter subunit IIA [Colidextribacter sp. OB.20]